MMNNMTARPTPRRKQFIAGLALLSATALAAACSGPATTAEAGEEEQAEIDWSQVDPAEEITWWSNHPGESKDFEEAMIAEFEAETGITVNLVTAGAGYDEVAQRFQAAAGTDSVPDLVIASDVWWFRYFINDQILPLDDVFAHLEVDVDDYNPTLYDDYEYEGEHYAAPYARSTPLFYYNKDLFAQAGLDDRGPQTWQEFEQWAPALAEVVPADGAPLGLGLGTSWSAWWMSNVLWGHGGQFSSEWEVTLDTPQAQAAGEWVRELYNDKGIAAVGTDTAADFSAGFFGAFIGSTGSLAGILDSASFEVGAAFLPEGPAGGGVPTGGTGVAIAADRPAENQLAAAMFLDFLTNTDNSAEFSALTGYMPVRTSALEADTMTDLYERIPLYTVAVEQLAEETRTQDWVRVFVPGGDQILSEGLEEIVLNNAPAAEVFDEITPRLQQAFSDNVEPYL